MVPHCQFPQLDREGKVQNEFHSYNVHETKQINAAVLAHHREGFAFPTTGTEKKIISPL